MRPLPLFLVFLLAAPAAAQDAPRKVAFVVGVGAYQFNYPDLGRAPVEDVTKLAAALKRGGFEAVVLTDAAATKAAVEKRFAGLLAGPKALRKGDVLLVALCGHGEQLPVPNPATGEAVDEPLFCPADAKPGDHATMVGLNWFIARAEANGPTTLFLVDACRSITDVQRNKGIQGRQVKLPPRTAILFSCGRGEVAHQSDMLGHGLFTHAVLLALGGEAGVRGDLSWTELVSGVEKSFQSNTFKKLIPAGRKQTPVEAKGEMAYTELLTIAGPAPKEVAPVAPTAPAAATVVRSLYGSDAEVRPVGEGRFGIGNPRFGVEAYRHTKLGVQLGITHAGTIAAFPSAAAPEPKKFSWSHGMEVRVRKADEAAITAATKRYVVEVYHDTAANRLAYVTDAGAVAYAPVPTAVGPSAPPTLVRRFTLKVRTPEQIRFDAAKRVGVEVFRDESTGGFLYVTETGAIATSSAPQGAAADPRSLYGLTVRVRTAAEFDFSDSTKQVALEVYEDTQGAALLYATHDGNIAAIPATKPGPKQGRKWIDSMTVRVRKPGVIDFDAAQKFGIEVNEDEATGARIFVCETGSLAVVGK